MGHRIELPTAIGMRELRSVLTRCVFFPETPARITLSFNPAGTRLDPVGVSMLAAWGAYWRARGTKLLFKNLDSPSLVYAQRMGLFRALDTEPPRSLREHEGAGRFVELRRIVTQSDLSGLCADIGGILRAGHLIEYVQYVLSEMTRNVLEHSGAEAFVAAQYYEKDKCVTIGIADCGQGIRRSLAGKFGFTEDAEAIVAALRPGVSGTTKVSYSSSDNAGLGLFYARGVAKVSQQPFCLVSGRACYKQLKPVGPTLPTHHAEDERHDLFTGLNEWHGTVVGIRIRGLDGTLSKFMARMRPILSVGTVTKHTTRINFTN